MKNKALIIGVIVLFLVAGGVFAFTRIKSTSDGKPTAGKITDGTMLGEKDRADNYIPWNDPAGFSFTYPESWLIDPHDQDVINYANLAITKRGNEGGILILAADSKYKTINDWVKKDALITGASFVETTLGGVIAQKALLSSGEIIIGAIDEGVLYTIKLNPDEAGYWKSEFDKLVTSFKFVYPTNYPTKNTSGSQTGTSGDVVEEEEEVID